MTNAPALPRHDVKVTAFRPRTVALAAALTLLTLTGCAAEPAPAGTPDAAVETQTPAPIAVGDVLTAEQATELNAGNDLMKAYPVGDQFIAVQWGQPVPDAVVAEVQEQIISANPEYGTSDDHKVNAVHWEQLKEVMGAESKKLGGISISIVSCALSFSEITNSYNPTWVMSEPGPVGQYGSRDEVLAKADAWSEPGKKMYVVINNLGC